jgi:hypothetical protein
MQEAELEAYVEKKLRSTNFPAVWAMLLHLQYVEDVVVGAECPGCTALNIWPVRSF